MFQGLPPQALYSTYKGKFTAGSGNYSPAIWCDIVGNLMPPDGLSSGILVGDDFTMFNDMIGNSGTATLLNGYKHLGSGTTADTAKMSTTVARTLVLNAGATGNLESYLQSASGTGVYGAISDATPKVVAFEAIAAVGSVTDSVQDSFVGLAYTGAGANLFLSDTTGAMQTTGGYIGFNQKGTDGNVIEFVYNKASGTQQVVGDAVGSAVAGTFYNLGFVYNPEWPDAKKIRCYVDNEEMDFYVAATNGTMPATLPLDVMMNAIFALKSNTTTATTLSIKGWRAFFQT